MQRVSIICVGKMKEKFYIDAAAEYVKRLSRFCKLEILELPEERLPENPSQAQIDAALAKEADAILQLVLQKTIGPIQRLHAQFLGQWSGSRNVAGISNVTTLQAVVLPCIALLREGNHLVLKSAQRNSYHFISVIIQCL